MLSVLNTCVTKQTKDMRYSEAAHLHDIYCVTKDKFATD